MLRMNIWGMNMEMLMLGMLGSFDKCNVRSECENVRSECFHRCNVRSECGNVGMLQVNVFIGAILEMNVLIGAMLGVNVEIGEC